MGKLLRKILDVIAWIALIVGIIMVIWRIFGDSPTDLAVISPFIVLGLAKIWTNNNNIKEVDYQIRLLARSTKHSFEKVREDIDKLSNKRK